MVAWLFVAALWMIILVSWFIFGIRGDDEFLAQLTRTILAA